MQINHKWVLTEEDHVFGRRGSQLFLCGAYPCQDMVNTAGVEVKDDDLVVFHFVTKA